VMNATCPWRESKLRILEWPLLSSFSHALARVPQRMCLSPSLQTPNCAAQQDHSPSAGEQHLPRSCHVSRTISTTFSLWSWIFSSILVGHRGHHARPGLFLALVGSSSDDLVDYLGSPRKLIFRSHDCCFRANHLQPCICSQSWKCG
jgi:hypothetical protein